MITPKRALGAQHQLAQVGPGGVRRRGARRRARRSGVATRRPTTIWSKRPKPALFWPLLRVAAKPPMEANSKDCGKWPSVRPCAARAASACGPRIPGCRRGGHRDRVHLEQLVQPDQVEADQAGVPLPAGDQATGDRRAAAERDDRDVVLHGPGQHGDDLVVRAGARRPRRERRTGRRRAPCSRSGVDLPRVRSAAGGVVGEHVLRADDRPQRVSELRGQPRAGQLDRCRRPACSTAPNTASTRPWVASGNGPAWAASPQRWRVHLEGHALQCDI